MAIRAPRAAVVEGTWGNALREVPPRVPPGREWVNNSNKFNWIEDCFATACILSRRFGHSEDFVTNYA